MRREALPPTVTSPLRHAENVIDSVPVPFGLRFPLMDTVPLSHAEVWFTGTPAGSAAPRAPLRNGGTERRPFWRLRIARLSPVPAPLGEDAGWIPANTPV